MVDIAPSRQQTGFRCLRHHPLNASQHRGCGSFACMPLGSVYVCVCMQVPIKYTWPCYLWGTICVPGT